MRPNLTVQIGSLTLKNPLIAASGVYGYGLELADFCPPESLGAVILKGISLTPWPGNPLPRAVEAAGGLVNAIGLENMGVKAFLTKALPPLKARKAVVGANVIGRTLDDYAQLAQILAQSPVDFLELNISCPNLAQGGLSFGSDPDQAARLTADAVKKAGDKPVVVKLPPLVTDIALLAQKVIDAGATAISLINTVPALVINPRTRRAALGNVTGGLSGPPIKPLALRQVYLAAKAVKAPVIGLGGIFSALDAAEFIVAGATAVQIGTAILADPGSPLTILKDLFDFFSQENIPSVPSLRGTLKGPNEP
ncbi:MAG: dihydroorotate dehydrogenase [Deltaproteobacteria bacterium]|jgi:dihydroorotate dehydrogenase (NAD+) catalytic subunit|nr:dihydroorotate dehydrogenase [Deltaproteobacteria bacterium]